MTWEEAVGTATGIEWVEAREAAQHPPGHSPQQSVAVRRAVELRVRKADPDRQFRLYLGAC